MKKSEWHNPFSAQTHGLEKSIQLYEAHIRKEIASDFATWIPRIDELVGKTLGCWCKPAACHGDVIVRIVSEYIEACQDPTDEKIDAFLDRFG